MLHLLLFLSVCPVVSGLWAAETEGNVQPPEEENDWDDVISAQRFSWDWNRSWQQRHQGMCKTVVTAVATHCPVREPVTESNRHKRHCVAALFFKAARWRERSDWRGVHGRSSVHQQIEEWSEDDGETLQTAGEHPVREQQEDGREREGAGRLPAAHLPGSWASAAS